MLESNRDDLPRLEQRLADLHSLVQVLSEVNRSLDLADVLHASLEGIQHVIGGEFGCFLLIEPNTNRLQLAHPTRVAPLLIESLQKLTLRPEISASISRPQDRLQIISTLGQDIRELLQAHGVGPFALIPLTARGRAVGVLVVGISPDKMLAPPSIDLLMSIGEQVGLAIENARLHASVRESEEWHRAFIEDSPDGFWEGDAEGKMTFINDAGCRIFDGTREELLGLRPLDLVPDPEISNAALQLIRQAGSFSNFIAPVRTRKGEGKTLSVTARLVRDGEGRVLRFQSIFRDISEQHRLMEALRRRNHELDTLNAISSILSRPQEINRALDQVCEQIATITGMETAALCLNDESQWTMNLLAHRGMDDAMAREVRRVGLDDPVARLIAVEGKTIALHDTTQFPGQGLAAPREAGYLAGIGVPITVRGKPIGGVFVGSRVRREYEDSDIALLVNIGQRLGLALENADLYAQMQRRVEELDGLARLSAACASSLDPQAISQLAVEWTQKLLQVAACSLRLLEGDCTRVSAAVGYRQGVTLADPALLDEPTRRVIEKRLPLVVDDSSNNLQLPSNLHEYLESHGAHSCLVVPMPTPDGVIGVLSVAREEPHTWSRQEIDLLQTIANQAANSIANALLFQKVSSEQRKVQAIFDSGLSGLYATDVKGRLTMLNRAAERMTGWTLNDVRGRTWQEVFANRDESSPPLICGALQQKRPAYRPDGGNIRTRDGRILPVAEAVAPLLNDNGSVAGAVGAFWDLTREKEAELNREEFLRMVAHQMRNPLTALLGGLALLQGGHLNAADAAEIWQVVRTEGERLGSFARQFLDLERSGQTSEPVACAPLALAPLVRRLVREFRLARPEYHFRLQHLRLEPVAYAELERVENILRNLLDNAVTYSPEAGLIQVSARVREERDLIDLAVRDRGVGISLPEQGHVFEPFYRTSHPQVKRVYGHGLGLYIARKMAREMGGDIEVESREGHGSTFHFYLRRCP